MKVWKNLSIKFEKNNIIKRGSWSTLMNQKLKLSLNDSKIL